MKAMPHTFSGESVKLGSSDVDVAGQAALGKLNDKGYEVHQGLTEAYARDVVSMALEPSIVEYCPNDSGARFKDLDAAADWLSKQRAVFLLLARSSEGLQLAGYGWVGQGESNRIPDGGDATFAVRIGEAHQGKGLATPYAQTILSASIQLYDVKHMWLEAWQSNAGAVHVYQKLGFELAAEVPAERPSHAGGTVDDVRLYMHQLTGYNTSQ